ncbi:telomere-associated protein RIF1 isoform X6 [Nannospalax galili]|uniref:telomere-associated protein RIF1 isoform X6 n=1 Tax=Nannospalax galili TaxID=1026970 RepID=UPI00111C6DAF|nr:telomere-associated protein RIF1 isoform X6 [Nannospalax galili]
MTAAGRSPLEPLLETWEDPSASPGEQTDAYLSLTSRMTGEEGKEVITEIEKNLPRLYRVLKAHISSQNSELSSAALQALGFCLYNPKITSGLSGANIQELLLKLSSIIKSSDKNVCTRALWVISKQTFPTEVVNKMVSSIIDSLEVVLNKGGTHSAVVDFEALNVIIRLIEQAPIQMGEESVRWAKLVIPLVVHSAQKVHLRGATALEMGMPLLLQKQQEIASITEHLMTTKLISELQKLFVSKNETYVLKLWPLFVKLLGKTLHRSGSFINSLLQLEELGFRSGTPMIKKIAFIAWKSLIDNFALNPDILCSAKRLKLLMQPLSSIHVRTETLALTKLEVWWYLLMRLGPQLPGNFEQVCVPLIQSTISVDNSTSPQGSSSRGSASQGLSPVTSVHKGASIYGVPVTPRMNSSSNIGGMATIPSIQLLGLEMLLHFLLGPEVMSFAKQHKLVLSLEPLEYPLIGSPSFFSKHANTLITAVRDSFVAVGKDASDAVVSAIWNELINLVKSVTESGSKKERPGSEALTLLLKSLENIVKSEVFPVSKALVLMEITIKGLPPKVLGSPAYQVANMDILNGTPALFLIHLIFNNNLLECGVADERFFLNLQTLVGCVLSGPTSPLAFSESVLNVINQNAKQLENKEHLWRMWSIIVTPLTDLINQTNEVNQGDALEHNFSAIYCALTLPINNIFSTQTFPMTATKMLLKTWSELYRSFARCAALVATAEENLCCEELCSKIMSSLEDEALSDLLFLDRISHIITVMVDCIDFSPYNIKYQPQIKLPQRSSDWAKKKKEPLGKLASLFKLLVRMIHSFQALSYKEVHTDTLLAIGTSITSILSNVFGHISLPSMIREIFATLTRPLALLYENSKSEEVPKVYSCLNNKLEKLLGEIIACLQFSYTGTYDSELLEQLSPLLCMIFLHKNKQIRKQSALFWNATFAKVTVLVYPEELKPVLRQAKQNFLLLLPGLENVEMMEESSGPYSDATENSQLNIKISGMERKSSARRDSFLAQTKDKKENMKPSAKLKVESSSPKIKSDKLLEEEKSVDFVFIPPEGKDSKQRILTEHQKEVLKAKRYDIPALYNNLDVSQDTLLSAQFSQEESMESLLLTEKPKEDSKMMIKEEQGESDIFIPQDAMESCECMSHIQDYLSEAAIVHEDTEPKSTVEDVLENKTTEERNIGINVESKENTPPASTPTDQVENEDSQAVVATNPVTLRRSSRRRSELVESSTDSQDKENSQQRKERRKEDEKTVQKSSSHVKDDKLPKQKLTADQTIQESLTEKGNELHEKTSGEPSANVEIDQNKRKPDLENVRSEGDGAQDIVDKSSEKPLRGRTRYLTRRASQGLLSSIENSESDSSEAKEEVSKKKRTGKWKNKSNDSVDVEEQEGKTVEDECIKTDNQTDDCKAFSEVHVDTGAQNCEKSESNIVTPQDSTGSSDLMQISVPPAIYEEKSKPSKCADYSFASPPVPESSLRTRNASKRLHKRDSNNSVRECSKTGKPDVSVPSGKCVQALECQHKRSRRVRRSKGCDCCGEKSQPQEKSFIGLKNTENYALKSVETKKTDVQAPGTVSETYEANQYSEQPDVNFGLGLKEDNGTVDNLITSETELKEDTQNSLMSEEIVNMKEKTCDGSSEAVSESQEPCSEKDKDVDPALSDSKGMSQECLSLDTKAENPEATLKRELNTDDEVNTCRVVTGSSPEEVEAMVLDAANDTSEAVFEKESSQTDIPEEMATEESDKKDEPEAGTAGVSTEETVTEGFNSCIGLSDSATPLNTNAQTEVSEELAGGELGGSNESDSCSCEETNKEKENDKETVIAQVNTEIDSARVEDTDTTANTSKGKQTQTEGLNVEADSFVPGTLEMNTDEVKTDSCKTETNMVLEAKLADNQIAVENDILQETRLTLEKVEEVPQSLTSEMAAELVAESSDASPEKLRELDPLLGSANESPSGMQARCIWSPLASPSTSILKRGLKRSQEDEISSPVNKVRRVSFADPIYQAGLADDIDRRCSIVRSHSSNNSPIIKSVKTSPTAPSKHNTTSIKGFLSPGSRSSKFKSSKKCLIAEMAKESMLSPTESVYPALVNCAAPVDIILPQITSNMWARGLGQLIRAKNIKTIGDLSTLTASEIKTLPIRSPKVSNVKKALRVYHEQQMKSRGLEEIPVFDISDKAVNGIESKPLNTDEDRLVSDLMDPVTLDTPLSRNLMTQISALALQLDSEDLYNYSGSQLFEMHEKLGTMANCIIKNLQSRWRSPAHENSV